MVWKEINVEVMKKENVRWWSWDFVSGGEDGTCVKILRGALLDGGREPASGGGEGPITGEREGLCQI